MFAVWAPKLRRCFSVLWRSLSGCEGGGEGRGRRMGSGRAGGLCCARVDGPWGARHGPMGRRCDRVRPLGVATRGEIPAKEGQGIVRARPHRIVALLAGLIAGLLDLLA